MKLLFITRKFPPSTGGMETFAYDLYSSLSKKVDIKLIKWGRSNKFLPLVLPYFFLRASFLLLKGGIDIIHIQDGVIAPIGYTLSKLFSKPYTVVIHGLDITYKNKLFQFINLRAIKHADFVFCISQAAADEAIKRGVDISKLKVIPLGIPDDNFAPKDLARKQLVENLELDNPKCLLLTVGRLVKRKGVEWFIENVLPNLVKKYPDLIYLVVGEGAYKPNIEMAISKTGLQNNIKMLGKVDDKTLKDLYNGTDIFVMPNIPVKDDIEGFGRVLLEASLCKLPVVASGIEGIKDAIIDDKNGKLVEAKNANAYEEEINKFIKNKDYAKDFGEKSRQYTLNNYQWDTIANEYIGYYKKLKNIKH